jgi:hypothetical protein
MGPEMPGDRLRPFCLVVTVLHESDGEGADRPRALRLHERHDGRRIDTSDRNAPTGTSAFIRSPTASRRAIRVRTTSVMLP